MINPSATPNTYPYPNEPLWSRSEKVIAHKAFDAALKRELHEVMQEALAEEGLHGLREDKLKSIRSIAKLLAEDAA